MVYEIMHGEKIVAKLNTNGECQIVKPAFLSYHLYLEEEKDIDSRMNNIMNFYDWCATRVLTLDRQYANQAFHSYDTIEGANCQSVLPEIMTQKDTAIQAVKQVGLNQRQEIKED